MQNCGRLWLITDIAPFDVTLSVENTFIQEYVYEYHRNFFINVRKKKLTFDTRAACERVGVCEVLTDGMGPADAKVTDDACCTIGQSGAFLRGGVGRCGTPAQHKRFLSLSCSALSPLK